jgi:transcriptional regulator with XRE-family HTH domain
MTSLKNKRASDSKKNPLALAFGMALKKLRGDKNSSAIAEKLNLSNSFVRLLETGATNIHAGKAIKLLDTFPEVEFDPLCKLLTAISITDAFKDSVDGYIGILNDLSKLDDQYSSLFEALIQIMHEIRKDPNKAELIIETNKYEATIIKFLSDPFFGKIDKSENSEKDEYDLSLYNLLDKTPSIYVDTIINNLKSLSTINPNLFVNDSSAWEKENGHNFIGLIAVIRNFDGIITPDNINKFNYKYLKNDDFIYLRFIILNENKSSEMWRGKFIEILGDRWNEKLKESVQNKIEIKKHNQRDPEISEYLKSGSSLELYDLVWIFITKNGNKVGFALKDQNIPAVSPSQSVTPLGEALSYSVARNKYNSFYKIWNKS